MPRRGKIRSRGRGSGRRNNSAIKGRMTSVAFHRLGVTTLSGVTGNATILLSPQQSGLGSIDNMCDEFDLFRFIRLEYRLHPMDPTDTTFQSISYVPDIDVQTVTPAQNSFSPLSSNITPFSGVPSSWVKVPPSQLKGMLDWYKCTADAGAAEFESQGIIILAGGLSDTCNYEVRGVCQFKNPLSEAVMMEKKLARFERLGLVVRIPKKPAETSS